MSSLVEQIKARLSIVDVVGSYVKLEKQGTTLKTRCPFHSEKTASFVVSPTRNSFYCFGCNKGGDIITFVEEIEGLDFKGALTTLATRAGLDMQDFRVSKEETDEKGRLRGLLETAATFYEAKLVAYPAAADYIRERGVTDETRKKFRIGYAPDSWQALYDYLKSRGYGDDLMLRAGMTIKTERGQYDRFRNRIMFPLADSGGAVVGFSGRILPGTTQTSSKEQAKYVNSPETPLYNKSQLLYGFDKAKLAMRKSDSVVLVEGQLDMVLSHQAGVENAVAVSGTALTTTHLQMVHRLCNTIVMAFDQDVAGFNAARRGIEMALTLGMDVRVALVPHAKDPADLVRENPALWRETVAGADPVIDALLKTIPARQLSERDSRRVVETEVLPYVARLVSKLDQAHYVERIAEFLHIAQDPIWETLRSIQASIRTGSTLPVVPEVEPVAPKWQRTAERLLGILLWQEGAPEPVVDVSALRTRLGELLGPPRAPDLAALEANKESLIFTAELQFQGHSDLKRECRTLLRALEEEFLKEQFAEAMKKLREAEKKKDHDAIERYVQACTTISNHLHTLKKTII